MGLFSRFRGNHDDGEPGDKSSAGAQASRKAAAIAYDAGLIDRLKAEHRELQRVFAAVRGAAAESRFGDIGQLFGHFRHTLQAHIAAENSGFYPYLLQRVARDREAADLIGEARREMNDIAFEVLKFVDAYTAYPPTHLTETRFKFDLQEAEDLLAKRVQKVETQLYPLYRP